MSKMNRVVPFSENISNFSALLLQFISDDKNKNDLIKAFQKALADYDEERLSKLKALGEVEETATNTPEEAGWAGDLLRTVANTLRQTYEGVLDQSMSNTALFFRHTIPAQKEKANGAIPFNPKEFILSLLERKGTWEVGGSATRPSLKVRIMGEIMICFEHSLGDATFDCLEDFDTQSSKPPKPLCEFDQLQLRIVGLLTRSEREIDLMKIPGQAELVCRNMLACESQLQLSRLMQPQLSIAPVSAENKSCQTEAMLMSAVSVSTAIKQDNESQTEAATGLRRK